MHGEHHRGQPTLPKLLYRIKTYYQLNVTPDTSSDRTKWIRHNISLVLFSPSLRSHGDLVDGKEKLPWRKGRQATIDRIDPSTQSTQHDSVKAQYF